MMNTMRSGGSIKRRTLRACGLTAAACLLLGLTPAGCGGARKVEAGGARSLTRGVAMRIYMTDGEEAHALYTIEPDGTLGFAGGADARRDTLSWKGVMTEDDAAALREVLEANHWLSGRPSAEQPDADRNGAFRYEIDFASPEVRWSLDAPSSEGGGGEIAPVIEHVRELFTRKRHGGVFDQLPEAGPR